MARGNKSRRIAAIKARQLRQRRQLGRQMSTLARWALIRDGKTIAVLARYEDARVLATEMVAEGSERIILRPLHGEAERAALHLSSQHLVVRNGSPIAAIANEEDALLLEALVAEKDELGAQRSVRGDVLDSTGAHVAGYVVGKRIVRRAWLGELGA